MSEHRFADLKARARGQAVRRTDVVAAYIADLDDLAESGIGMVLIDRFLPFLEDAQNELITGLDSCYQEDEVLAIEHQDYADLCQSNGQLSNVVDLTLKNDQAATFPSVSPSSWLSSSVTRIPSLNFTPSSTSVTSSWPLNRRQRSCAVASSL